MPADPGDLADRSAIERDHERRLRLAYITADSASCTAPSTTAVAASLPAASSVARSSLAHDAMVSHPRLGMGIGTRRA